MKISISKKSKIDNPKVYTFGFETTEVKDLEHLSSLANHYAVAVAIYEGGHRDGKNVIEGGNYIFIDCDEPNQYKAIETKIQAYDYIKVPSRSCDINNPYKFHYIIPTQVPLQILSSAMKYQVQMFFNQVGITTDMFDNSGSFDIARQFAPAVVARYYDKDKKVEVGLTEDEAEELTEINDTGLQVPITTDIPDIYLEPNITSHYLQGSLVAVDDDVNSTDTIKDNILDRSKSVYYRGQKVSLDDIEAKVFKTIGKAGREVVSGFGCPCCNPEHSGDVTSGYGFAFIDNITGCMMIKCTGNACSDNPLYTLPLKLDSDMVFTEAITTNDDIVLSNSFKTRWETKLGNVSNLKLDQNWKQNFNAFANVVTRNQNNEEPIKIICPSPTGSGKSQQIIHKAIDLYNTDVSSLIVVLRTKDADELAEQIQELTSPDYVAVYHSNEVTKPVVKTKDAQCLIVTHSMFLKYPNLADKKDLVVIDEAINCIQNINITKRDLELMLKVFNNKGITNETTTAIAGIASALDAIDKEHKNNTQHQLFGDDGFEHKIPEPTSEMFDALGELTLDFIKLQTGRTGIDLQNSAIRNSLLKILDTLPILFDNWCYVSKSNGLVSLNSALEIIPNKSVVIMDATATVNSLYKLYSRYKKNLIVLPKIDCRDYSNVSLHSTNKCNTGKSSITQDKQYLKNFVKTVEDNTTDDDAVLVVTFKDIKNELQSYFDTSKVKVENWGNLTGTNQYSYCNKIFLFGLNHKPKEVIINQHTLSKGANVSFLDNETNKQEIDELTVSDLSAEVIQAINRIRCRKTIDADGNCEPCDVYLTLPINTYHLYMMKKFILDEMPSIKFADLNLSIGDDSKRERYSLVETFLNQLEYMCSKDGSGLGVKLEDIRYSLGLDAEQFKGVKKSAVVTKTLEANYTYYEIARVDKRGRPKKTKDRYYLKK